MAQLDIRSIPKTPVPGWKDRFPWLAAGTTGRHGGFQEPNFGLFGDLPAGSALQAWEEILSEVDYRTAVHSRQVHGSVVHLHQSMGEGLCIGAPGDGHATREAGLLLTVTIADCVPVFMVSPGDRAIGLLHAGWRGIAAGILESGVATLRDRLEVDPSGLHMHLGPAICGSCYEVGPEVFRALSVPESEGLDLRAALVARAGRLGMGAEQISMSDACTKCSPSAFFSHRGGDRGRQIAYLAIRQNHQDRM